MARSATLPEVQLRRQGARLTAPPLKQMRSWAQATLGRSAAGSEISVLLVNPARSRQLNQQYRGQDHATNVLSFPAPRTLRAGAAASGGQHSLGDLVICPGVLRTEARAQRKSVRAHWAHLFVHGLLHLLGYDHENDNDARRMERREILILRRLGVANPYRRV
jgi:probable rRNA maturation factor